MFTVILDANNKVIHDPSQNDSGRVVVGGVINKQVNCADSFTFTIYPENVGYSDIEIMTTWLSVLKDGEVVFHGRVLAEKTGWNNEKEITCEGDLSILNDSILRPYSFSGTLFDYMTMLINQHNAQVGADKQIVIKTVDNPATQIIRRTADYKPTLQELFEKIVDYFGGYLVIEIENGVRKISYVTDSTSGTNQTLEIGKNIIDFQRTIAAESLATAIIPLGATSEETGQRLTITTVNDGSDFLASPDAATKGLIYAVYTFDGITDPAELKAKGQAVLDDLTRIVPRIELSAVDLSSAGYDIDAIGFFQYVTVQDNAHTVSGQYLITERTYNISAPEQDKVTFGGQEKTISGQSAKTQIDLSSVEDKVINKAVDIVQYQTDLLKGASGGFFVIGTNSQGKPSETYWMDTDSTATARKVLRINYNGIGFSANGISGPYDTAWTLDGNFNAAFIRVGILQDAAGKNSWNLDTGALTITEGSLRITTSSETYDVIALNSGDWHNELSPLQVFLKNDGIDAAMLVQAGGIFGYAPYADESTRKRTFSLSAATGNLLQFDGNDIRRQALGSNGTLRQYDGNDKLRTYLEYGDIMLYTSAEKQTAKLSGAAFASGGSLQLSDTNAVERARLTIGGLVFYNSSGVQTGFVGTNINDFVVDYGTTSLGWVWRKWYSGTWEGWMRTTISLTASGWSAWGNIFQSIKIAALTLPVTLAANHFEFVTSHATQDWSSWGVIVDPPTTTKTGSYILCRGARPTDTAVFTLEYYVKGVVA